MGPRCRAPLTTPHPSSQLKFRPHETRTPLPPDGPWRPRPTVCTDGTRGVISDLPSQGRLTSLSTVSSRSVHAAAGAGHPPPPSKDPVTRTGCSVHPPNGQGARGWPPSGSRELCRGEQGDGLLPSGSFFHCHPVVGLLTTRQLTLTFRGTAGCFRNGHATLRSHTVHRDPLSPHPRQHSLFVSITAIPTGVRWFELHSPNYQRDVVLPGVTACSPSRKLDARRSQVEDGHVCCSGRSLPVSQSPRPLSRKALNSMGSGRPRAPAAPLQAASLSLLQWLL